MANLKGLYLGLGIFVFIQMACVNISASIVRYFDYVIFLYNLFLGAWGTFMFYKAYSQDISGVYKR